MEKLTEAEFLQCQADDARKAMSRVLSLIGKNLVHGVDPRRLARTHPWLTLTGTAVTGFAAAAALTPTEKSREERALRRLAAIKRAAANPAIREAAYVDGDGSDARRKHGVFNRLLDEALKIARPMVIMALSAGIRAKMDGSQQSGPSSDVDSNAPDPSRSAKETH